MHSATDEINTVPKRARFGRQRLGEMLLAFGLGLLMWNGALDLGIWEFPVFGRMAASAWSFLLAGLLGSALVVTRARILLWVGAGVICGLFIVIVSTPFPMVVARSLVRDNVLQPADAVYVLGSGVLPDGNLPDSLQVPLIHAYEIIGKGYAPRLLISRLPAPIPSALPAVRRQMQALRLKAGVTDVGPVWTTFDEATQTAKLCRQMGWKRVIVVSHPCHMRRVAAVFGKAGVPILCSPCTEGSLDLSGPGNPAERLRAFGVALHELLGYQIYHRRGWI